jgi:hypothetical protein
LGRCHGREGLPHSVIDDLGVNVFSCESHAEARLAGLSADAKTNPGMNPVTAFAAMFGRIGHG